MTTIEPAIEQAVHLQLRRDPPFTEEDLAVVEALPVLRATDISDLARFTGLRALVLIAYGGDDLRPLAGLPLVALDVEVSAVSDLTVVADLPELRSDPRPRPVRDPRDVPRVRPVLSVAEPRTHRRERKPIT